MIKFAISTTLIHNHLGSAAYLTSQGQVTQTLNYLPYGEDWVDIQHYMGTRYSNMELYTFTGKEKDSESGFHYFGARYYDSELLTGWLSVDPMMDKYPSISPYNYCKLNPVILFDPDGRKDRPFREGIDKPVSEIPGTETPLYYIGLDGRNYFNRNAYNCHSYAWHNSKGDSNPGNKAPCYQDLLAPQSKWDNNPADDIIEQGAVQLGANDNNIPGDRLIYYSDENGNGMYDDGEYISHSAIVYTVDEEGYTTSVIAKMGEKGISVNHPRAEGYYETDTNPCTKEKVNLSRAYFRLPQVNESQNE